MIGVMFEWDKNITDEMGVSIRKVYLAPDKMYGVKHNGIRPSKAFIFETNNFVIEDYTFVKQPLIDWFYKGLIRALHPGHHISFQDEKLKKLFMI